MSPSVHLPLDVISVFCLSNPGWNCIFVIGIHYFPVAIKKLTTENGWTIEKLKLEPEDKLLPPAVFSVPPVAPKVLDVKPEPAPEPIGTLPCKSGKLNVLEPSPTPYVVLIAENKAEYVERLTACALHNKYLFVESSDLVGSVANPAIIIPPVGTVSFTSSPLPLNKLPVIVPEAVTAPVTSKATPGEALDYLFLEQICLLQMFHYYTLKRESLE